MPELITREEIAQIFRIDVQTVGRWIKAGRLPEPLPLGRCLRWRRADIEAILVNGISKGAARSVSSPA